MQAAPTRHIFVSHFITIPSRCQIRIGIAKQQKLQLLWFMPSQIYLQLRTRNNRQGEEVFSCLPPLLDMVWNSTNDTSDTTTLTDTYQYANCSTLDAIKLGSYKYARSRFIMHIMVNY